MFRRRPTNPNAIASGDTRTLGMTPEEAVDALLDREIAPADLPAALALIASDSAAAERLERTRSMFDDLRSPVAAPDLSRVVLAEVGDRRRWLAPSLQRVVTVGRLAVAACLLAAVAATLVVERVHPDAMLFGGARAQPLASVVEAGRQDAAVGLRQVGGLFDSSFLVGEGAASSMFLIGSLEPLDATGRLVRLSPVTESQRAPSDSGMEGVPVDLTGRDCPWSFRPAPTATDAPVSEETRWVLLPRSR